MPCFRIRYRPTESVDEQEQYVQSCITVAIQACSKGGPRGLGLGTLPRARAVAQCKTNGLNRARYCTVLCCIAVVNQLKLSSSQARSAGSAWTGGDAAPTAGWLLIRQEIGLQKLSVRNSYTRLCSFASSTRPNRIASPRLDLLFSLPGSVVSLADEHVDTVHLPLEHSAQLESLPQLTCFPSLLSLSLPPGTKASPSSIGRGR